MIYLHKIPVFTLILIAHFSLAQPKSGNYGSLSVAYDSSENRITGYFNDATGWDEALQEPKYTCTFYFSGTFTDSISSISSYYPGDTLNQIQGYIKPLDTKSFTLKLAEEHGGCWNVSPADSTGRLFSIESENECLSIRYVTAEKAFFHSKPSKKGLLESYIIHNDVVHIYYIKNDWVYVQFFNGERQTNGWIKISDLNP
jgi:hypothetical protein